MASLTNAAPKFIFEGINDQSRGTMVREPETYAQHTPLLRLFTETGPETSTLVNTNSGSFNGIFGSKTLARRGKYFNLQSLLAETLLAEGNPFFVKRLRPEDAPNPARIIVAMDIVEDDIPRVSTRLAGFNYPELVDENTVMNANGEVETVNGLRGKLVLIKDNESVVGTQKPGPGTFVSERDGTQSTLYPLFELPASFFGEPGNHLGLRLWAPTSQDANPYDEETSKEFKTRMYRAQFMRRNSAGSTPIVVPTVTGESYVDLCFTPGAYSESTDKEYYAEKVLTQAYEDDGIDSGTPPMYSPFEQIHVYQDNLDMLQQMVYDAEVRVNPSAITHLEGPGQVDLFSVKDIDGDPLHSILLEGPLDGGVELGQEATIFASGGGDGTTDLDMYETLVNRENRNFGELGDEYENLALYPFSVVYDTGLSMEGKYEMMTILGRRQDVRTVFTTYVEAEGRLPTKSEELSRTQALMARLRAYPESTLYGTAVCRAEILQQTGFLTGGGYTKPVPLVVDYAQRWAQMAGAGTGIMREGKDIDVSPNNRVQLVKDLNVKFFNQRMQSDLWTNGSTYSLTYDRRSQYYPALHSVYNDDTSVLVSPITVSICCDVMRLVRRVHAELSGNAKLTREQFIERGDSLILEMVDGKYNDRVVVVPQTYFTDADDQRGFSWHCKVTVYANNPRTVMIFDLETRRMEDLPQ
jgi:hypothetical protein